MVPVRSLSLASEGSWIRENGCSRILSEKILPSQLESHYSSRPSGVWSQKGADAGQRWLKKVPTSTTTRTLLWLRQGDLASSSRSPLQPHTQPPPHIPGSMYRAVFTGVVARHVHSVTTPSPEPRLLQASGPRSAVVEGI